MCCDTDGSGMHRLLCEPEPCLVRCAGHASSDTGADRCAIGDTAHASDTCAEPRADGSAECTADGSPEPAAFDCGGVGDEPAIDAADGGSDRGAHSIAEPHTERTADSSAKQCTVDVAEPRTDSGAAAAGRDMGADSELEAKFLDEARQHGLDGLKGHRSVGGVRASIYNAMPIEGAQALASFMDDFAAKNG